MLLHPDIGAPLHKERVIAVREEPNLHLEFYLQGVIDGMRSPWKLLVSSRGSSQLRRKLRTQYCLLLGSVFFSSATEDVAHDAL